MAIRIWIFTIVLIPILAACGGAPVAPTSSPTTTTITTDTEVTPDTIPGVVDSTQIMATVNGEPILMADYERVLQRRQQEVNAADPSALETFVLSTLINQKLTEQAAVQMGISISDEEIDAEVVALKALLENDENAWQEWLNNNLYTEEEFRVDLAKQLLAARVRDAVVGDIASENTRQVHARHILVDTEAQAQEIRNRIINGESFVDLAAQYSKDITTRDQGGDLGWFAREELLEPVVAEVAFSQPEGAISQPIPTRLGYHIIETLGFDDLPLQPEKQAQVAQVVFDEWLATLNDSAIIEIYN